MGSFIDFIRKINSISYIYMLCASREAEKLMKFINTLEIEFVNNSNAKNALEQKAYMRNQFEFYGLKSIERRKIQQPFFINKAIGWVLREFSKTNPQWVIEFTNKTELDKLSYRESLKLIKGNGKILSHLKDNIVKQLQQEVF